MLILVLVILLGVYLIVKKGTIGTIIGTILILHFWILLITYYLAKSGMP